MYIWKARPSSASNAIYGRIKCTLCSHDIPCNMISDQEKNITARKSRWLTSMHLTDLPVWPSLRRLPGREGNGQGRQLEPYLAGCFPCPRSSTDSPTADLTGLETKGWIWRQYLSLWNPMLHRDIAGGPVAKSPHPRFRGPGLIPGQRTRSHKPQIRSLRSSTEK